MARRQAIRASVRSDVSSSACNALFCCRFSNSNSLKTLPNVETCHVLLFPAVFPSICSRLERFSISLGKLASVYPLRSGRVRRTSVRLKVSVKKIGTFEGFSLSDECRDPSDPFERAQPNEVVSHLKKTKNNTQDCADETNGSIRLWMNNNRGTDFAVRHEVRGSIRVYFDRSQAEKLLHSLVGKKVS